MVGEAHWPELSHHPDPTVHAGLLRTDRRPQPKRRHRASTQQSRRMSERPGPHLCAPAGPPPQRSLPGVAASPQLLSGGGVPTPDKDLGLRTQKGCGLGTDMPLTCPASTAHPGAGQPPRASKERPPAAEEAETRGLEQLGWACQQWRPWAVGPGRPWGQGSGCKPWLSHPPAGQFLGDVLVAWGQRLRCPAVETCAETQATRRLGGRSPAWGCWAGLLDSGRAVPRRHSGPSGRSALGAEDREGGTVPRSGCRLAAVAGGPGPLAKLVTTISGRRVLGRVPLGGSLPGAELPTWGSSWRVTSSYSQPLSIYGSGSSCCAAERFHRRCRDSRKTPPPPWRCVPNPQFRGVRPGPAGSKPHPGRGAGHPAWVGPSGVEWRGYLRLQAPRGLPAAAGGGVLTSSLA